MLIVFTIAVTPKLYLHNTFTRHTDQLFRHTDPLQKSIVKYEYSCGFINDSIEGTSPFVFNDNAFALEPVSATGELPVEKTTGLHYLYLSHAYLRGPPAYVLKNNCNRIF